MLEVPEVPQVLEMIKVFNVRCLRFEVQIA